MSTVSAARRPTAQEDRSYRPAVYQDLAHRTVVVTGAARGIGAAYAQALLANGASVVAGDLDEAAMAETAARLSPSADQGAAIVAMGVDVRDPQAHRQLATAAIDRFGRLDGWINNAGVYRTGSVLDSSTAEVGLMNEVHVLGATLGVQAAAVAMGDAGGSIVNMASIAAFVVRPNGSAYGASKAAVKHLTEFQAVELGPLGIRVNAVAPGMVKTDMISWVTQNPALLEASRGSIPLRRLGTPGEIADCALFLLSDASRFMTGHTLVVDGGGWLR
ncbi:short-chain dehydrogenase/reductase SDR [Parafrankia sp. EAN1pec]|uniref:SDR family NAD(P)-dependent oxidoreductase n=1 Tax=Parafrankia sp. (strain EAN1pec) TaxID=298653 RepID=UPI0000544152|nr:short-chain dehydrogenase/reductase SDR [Frankia sp. EAN1pec]